MVYIYLNNINYRIEMVNLLPLSINLIVNTFTNI